MKSSILTIRIMKESLAAAKKIVADVYSRLPKGAFIAKAGITGYGRPSSKKRCTSILAKSKRLPTIRPHPIFARTSIFFSTSADRI